MEIFLLALVAVVSATNIWLTLSYRSAMRHAQMGEYTLCVQREAYDKANHNLEQTDAELQRADIETFQLVLASGTLKNRLIASHEAKLAKDLVYLNTPVVDGCELVKP